MAPTNSPYLWGIDLGGTKIEGAVIHRDHPLKPLARTRIATESQYGYEHILDRIALLVSELEKMTGLTRGPIGFGTPGTMDPILGILKNSNTLCLNAGALDMDLAQRLKPLVRLANDANCFALAEATLGVVAQQGIDAETVFGVIMGTGVGGGVVVRGRVLGGRQGIAGEWGHNILDESGGPCYCGKAGCVEKIISGPALEAYYKSLSGNQLPLKDILARTATDSAAAETLNRLVSFFGKAIAVVINILDPDAIVLGGGVGNTPELYTLGVEEARKYIFNNRIDTRFLKPSLGDSAGVFGAAMLWQAV